MIMLYMWRKAFYCLIMKPQANFSKALRTDIIDLQTPPSLGVVFWLLIIPIIAPLVLNERKMNFRTCKNIVFQTNIRLREKSDFHILTKNGNKFVSLDGMIAEDEYVQI